MKMGFFYAQIVSYVQIGVQIVTLWVDKVTL